MTRMYLMTDKYYKSGKYCIYRKKDVAAIIKCNCKEEISPSFGYYVYWNLNWPVFNCRY